MPNSLAYSISSAVIVVFGALAAAPPLVARCHTPRISARISSDKAAERAPGEDISFIAAPSLDQAARATAKLFRYSSGLAGSKTLPMIVNFGIAPSGGVWPSSRIVFFASVSMNTFSAMAL